jgi:hypothetical protein
MGGRTVNFAVNPTNSQIVFAATEFGGLWTSSNHGASWAHVDQVPLTAMEDVKFATSDPNLVIATGAYDGSIDNRGGGIWRSTNGGATWAKAPGSDVCALASNNGREIAIAPGTPGSLTVLVGMDCGIARSTDSGATWKLDNPPGNILIWDVKVRQVGANLQVDACGDGGYVRSNDGGITWATRTDWTAATFPHPAAGQNPFAPCRLATAPQDANTVFLATRSPLANPGDSIGETYQFESDDSGVNWHNLNVSIDGNGRDPSVLTFPAFDGLANHFEVFFLTDQVIMHLTCDTNNAQRCTDGTGANTATCQAPPNEGKSGAWLQWDGTIPHCATDPGDIAFDSTVGCPFLQAGDGGIFQTANAKDGCNVGNPNFATFTSANNGLHALWTYRIAGSAVSTGTSVNPNPHTDLYVGMQDNGEVSSNDDGATFHSSGCCDVFGTFAPQTGPPVTVLENQNGGFSLSGEDGTTAQTWTSPAVAKGGGIDAVANFGPTSFAFLTHDNATPPNYVVQVTTNSGSTWTQMGPTLPGPNSPLPNGENAIKASGTAAAPVFYLELTVAGVPTIYSLSGALNNTATLTKASTGLLNPYTFNVDPKNSQFLYTFDRGGATPSAKFSTDGGQTWNSDAGLTTLTTLGNVYPVNSAFGPNFNSFGFDPGSNTILAGTQFSGIFASNDNGVTWAQLVGSQQIPRVLNFFFDTRNPHRAYAGSQGRGLWRLDLSQRPATGVYTGPPGGAQGGTGRLAATFEDMTNGPSSPIIDAKVHFTLGSQVCDSTTDATGNATCNITLTQPKGSYTAIACFAGNAQWFSACIASPFTIGGWSQLTPAHAPSSRNDMGMAYDPVHHQTVLFGGSDSNGDQLGSTWIWDGTVWSQASPATSPRARYGIENSMVWDPALNKIVLFGGRTTDGNYQHDTWAWDGSTWTQISSATLPAAREHDSLAFDQTLNTVVLFGGFAGGSNYFGDTWKLTSTGWTKLTPTGAPSARAYASMTYSPQAGGDVLFGGEVSTFQTNETWLFKGGAWSKLNLSVLPPARTDSAVAYDSATGQIVLFGGWDNVAKVAFGDTWLFDGTAWSSQNPSPAPSARYDAGLAYGQSSSVVLFGGSDGSTKNHETWTWAP